MSREDWKEQEISMMLDRAWSNCPDKEFYFDEDSVPQPNISDARLIAAAPDMLAELKAVWNYFDEKELYSEDLANLEALIIRAEGGPTVKANQQHIICHVCGKVIESEFEICISCGRQIHPDCRAPFNENECYDCDPDAGTNSCYE